MCDSLIGCTVPEFVWRVQGRPRQKNYVSYLYSILRSAIISLFCKSD